MKELVLNYPTFESVMLTSLNEIAVPIEQIAAYPRTRWLKPTAEISRKYYYNHRVCCEESRSSGKNHSW